MFAFLIGALCGLRTMTPPALVSWAARFHFLNLESTPLAFLGWEYTPYVLTVCMIGELIVDKLPQTPSRKAPMGFGARMVSGAMCGAALGGLLAGILGAIVGTLGGYELRVRATKAIGGKGLPVALLEDAIAVGGAAWIVFR